MDDLAKDMKYYPYYYQVYSAVLGGFLGEYQVTVQDPEAPSKPSQRRNMDCRFILPSLKPFLFSIMMILEPPAPMVINETIWATT